MAATKAQGSSLAVFWTSITVFCAGIAYFAEGFGKLVFLIGLAGVVISLLGFLKLKAQEGQTAGLTGSPMLKLLGILVVWGGWFVTVGGLHLTPSVGGRLFFALAGIAVSLVGIIGILPVAFGKSMIGKTVTSSYAAKTTMEHSR